MVKEGLDVATLDESRRKASEDGGILIIHLTLTRKYVTFNQVFNVL